MAVKLFRDGAVDEEQTRRQSEEMRILAGMAHHALVTLFDAGADTERPGPHRLTYLVMELVRGPDLRRRFAQGPLSAAHMALIGHDLADGLAYIHHHGIIHRDVKPANILLVDYSAEDRATARQTQRLRRGHHHPRRPPGAADGSSGTPAYLSPEQAAGEPAGPRQRRLLTGTGPAGRADREDGLPRRARSSPPWPGCCRTRRSRRSSRPCGWHCCPPCWPGTPRPRPPAREVSLALRQEVINGAGRHRRDAAPAADRRGRAGCAPSSATGSWTPRRTAPSTGSQPWRHACSRCPWRSSASWTMTGSGSRPTTAPTSRRSAATRGCAPPPSCRTTPGSSRTPP